MRVVLRYPVAAVAAAAALVLVVGDYLVLRAEKPPNDVAMIDFSKQRYYSPQNVARVFAKHGIGLRRASTFGGFVVFSTARRPLHAHGLQVIVGPRTGTHSFGPKLQPYDARFGNVLVSYGGIDERLLANAQAAVATLRLR